MKQEKTLRKIERLLRIKPQFQLIGQDVNPYYKFTIVTKYKSNNSPYLFCYECGKHNKTLYRLKNHLGMTFEKWLFCGHHLKRIKK